MISSRVPDLHILTHPDHAAFIRISHCSVSSPRFCSTFAYSFYDDSFTDCMWHYTTLTHTLTIWCLPYLYIKKKILLKLYKSMHISIPSKHSLQKFIEQESRNASTPTGPPQVYPYHLSSKKLSTFSKLVSTVASNAWCSWCGVFAVVVHPTQGVISCVFWDAFLLSVAKAFCQLKSPLISLISSNDFCVSHHSNWTLFNVVCENPRSYVSKIIKPAHLAPTTNHIFPIMMFYMNMFDLMWTSVWFYTGFSWLDPSV